MGHAPDDLSQTLIRNYLTLLGEEKSLPSAILLYGEGVKLVCDDSQVLEPMKKLNALGVNIIVCKTCLNYFGLLEKIRVGQVGTMADIVTMQLEAGKVITL